MFLGGFVVHATLPGWVADGRPWISEISMFPRLA